MTTSRKQSTKTWVRAVEKTRKFPENKYGFSLHLRNVNDYLISHPGTIEEFYHIKYAAYAWAYQHKCRIVTKKINMEDGKFKIYIRLSSKNRVREYV